MNYFDEESKEVVNRIFGRMEVTACGVGQPRLYQIIVHCDYFTDAFSTSSDAIWYKTVLCLSINPSEAKNITVVSLFAKTLVANRPKNDYEKAKKEWKQPKIPVEEAENFAVQALVNAIASEYPGTIQ